MRQAQANKVAILVFFSAAEAENSRYLEDKVFTDSRVRRAVQERFVPVKIDVSKNPEMARTLGIYRGGVVCLYQSDGKPLVSAPLSSIRIPEDLLKAIQ